MSINPDDLKMLINKYKNMNIEELEASIALWEKNTKSSYQLPWLDIAKNELEMKHIERQEQIELLTKSLTSSSRFGRWVSSIRTIFIQFAESKK